MTRKKDKKSKSTFFKPRKSVDFSKKEKKKFKQKLVIKSNQIQIFLKYKLSLAAFSF